MEIAVECDEANILKIGLLARSGCFREDEEHRFKTKRSPVFSEILGEEKETQPASRALETDLEIGQLKSALLAWL